MIDMAIKLGPSTNPITNMFKNELRDSWTICASGLPDIHE